MGQVGFIAIVLKFDLEGQSVIETSTLFLHAILVIADVVAFPHPADPLLIGRVFRLNERLLTLVV